MKGKKILVAIGAAIALGTIYLVWGRKGPVSNVTCVVLCGGQVVDANNFTDYPRLIVLWPKKKAYTMGGFSDDKVRSGMVPIQTDESLGMETEWCQARGIAYTCCADQAQIYWSAEIEPYL